MNIFIDDLIRKLNEIRNDGYYYCDIDLLDGDEFDGEIIPPSISFSAIEEGGIGGIDYNDNEETEVYEIPEEELETYAYCRKKPAPMRKPIKKLIIED